MQVEKFIDDCASENLDEYGNLLEVETEQVEVEFCIGYDALISIRELLSKYLHAQSLFARVFASTQGKQLFSSFSSTQRQRPAAYSEESS